MNYNLIIAGDEQRNALYAGLSSIAIQLANTLTGPYSEQDKNIARSRLQSIQELIKQLDEFF